MVAKRRSRVCHDMLPTSERDLIARAERAKEVDPRNAPPPEAMVRAALTSALCLTGTDCEPVIELTPGRMAGLTTKFWKVEQEVTFGFLRATAGIATHARNAFAEVGKHANLKFREVSASSAMIRITDDPNAGAYSYLGTDCLGIPRNQPTMNLARTWADFATAIHEVCHGEGMIHEHQSPKRPDDFWNEPAVYRSYGGPPNNWGREQIKSNVIDRYSTSQTQYTEWDRASIMLYPLEAELLKNPAYATGWNKVLSAMDKAFLGRIYPFAAAPPTDELTMSVPRSGTWVWRSAS